MISASQMRAAKALLGRDRKTLVKRSGLSVPTIRRMEAAEGAVLGAVDAQQKVIRAFREVGTELIGDHERSGGGSRGVRQAHPVGEAGLTH
ncbi:helix-turn-helix domain-containing protein [Mesorhizobium sp. LjNodule214]|uniref:helix-turn-helix domain-containing protein n=1 Tax=Mesorhizobium sp. LjNodule214 TaxID=3342252 RepID=UPI003ECD078A